MAAGQQGPEESQLRARQLPRLVTVGSLAFLIVSETPSGSGIGTCSGLWATFIRVTGQVKPNNHFRSCANHTPRRHSWQRKCKADEYPNSTNE
jgi:hypothetical protein